MKLFVEGNEVRVPFELEKLNLVGSGVTVTPRLARNDKRLDLVLSASGGAGLVDGDYGDITVSGSGTAMAIDAAAVTYAKIQSVTAARLLGRRSGSSGSAEELTLGSFLSLSSGGILSCSATSVTVNGGSAISSGDLSDSTPAATAGKRAVAWQTSGVGPTSISGQVDSGATLFKALSSSATAANSITAQPWFPTNGAVTVTANRTYRFHGLLVVNRNNSGTIRFNFGGTATISSALYRGIGQSAAVNVNGTGQTSAWSDGSGLITVQPNGTAGWCEIDGIVRIGAGGTLIPQFTISITPTVASVASGTFFELTEIGADTVTERGSWA